MRSALAVACAATRGSVRTGSGLACGCGAPLVAAGSLAFEFGEGGLSGANLLAGKSAGRLLTPLGATAIARGGSPAGPSACAADVAGAATTSAAVGPGAPGRQSQSATVSRPPTP